MNIIVAEQIVLRWYTGLNGTTPTLTTLGNLAEAISEHLPDPAFNGIPSPTTVYCSKATVKPVNKKPGPKPKAPAASTSGKTCTYKGCS